MRTDTERLDWMQHNRGPRIRRRDRDGYYEVDMPSGSTFEHGTIRAAIDAAMDAAEGQELEEAWRWFREDKGEFCIILKTDERGELGYKVSDCIPFPIKATRDAAILAAYRASKGSKP